VDRQFVGMLLWRIRCRLDSLLMVMRSKLLQEYLPNVAARAARTLRQQQQQQQLTGINL
jgi:hypothetical protein